MSFEITSVIETDRMDIIKAASYPALAYLSSTQVSDWEESPYSMMTQLYGKTLNAKFARLLEDTQDFFVAFEYYNCDMLETTKKLEFEALLNDAANISSDSPATTLVNTSMTASKARTFSSINRQRVTGLIADFNKEQLEVENLLKRKARASFESQAFDLNLAERIINDMKGILATWRLGNAISYIQLNSMPVDSTAALTEADVATLSALGDWFARALAFEL